MGRATTAASTAASNVLLLLLALAGAASATTDWTVADCVENAEYTGGFDFVAGYRYRSEIFTV